jgi:hypothetical protein
MLHTRGPSLGFSKLFQVVIVVVVRGDILRLMALMLRASRLLALMLKASRLLAQVLRANRLLAMGKDTNGFHFIAIGEVFLRFINYSIVLQLWGPFQEHLSPH